MMILGISGNTKHAPLAFPVSRNHLVSTNKQVNQSQLSAKNICFQRMLLNAYGEFCNSLTHAHQAAWGRAYGIRKQRTGEFNFRHFE